MDTRTHNALGVLKGHESAVSGVAFSTDGRTLASASYDTTVRLWDMRTHKPLGLPLRGAKGPVNAVAFSPDGRTLASASDDNTVRLWDVRTHRPLGGPLRGRIVRPEGTPSNVLLGIVYGVAFSADARTIVSGGADGMVRLWDGILWRNLADLRTIVCGLVGGGLSRAEWAQYVAALPYRTTCP